MRKLLLTGVVGIMLAGLAAPATAQPSIRLNIPLPPPLVLPKPPSVVVLPNLDVDVYVAPDLDEDLFFWDGWWWRPWQGRWYRSRHHDRDWVHYGQAPAFHRHVPRGWRDDYRHNRWGRGTWKHRPIPHHDLQQNWKGWRDSRHWRKPENRQHEGGDGPGRDRIRVHEDRDRGRDRNLDRDRDRNHDRDREGKKGPEGRGPKEKEKGKEHPGRGRGHR